MRVVLIINGSRKMNKAAQQVLHLIEQKDTLHPVILETSYPKEAITLVKENCLNGDVVIAVGGDGTCHEVINGIMGSDLKNIRFGIVPLGTGNDFMKMIESFNPEELVTRITEDISVPIDIGRINDQEEIRFFLNITGAGLDGKVIDIMNRQRKAGIGGKLSYASAIIRAFFSFKRPIVRIIGDEFEYKGEVLMVTVCNGKVFGHGLTINPQARIDDGILDITILGKVTLKDYLKNLKKLKTGQKIDHPEVYYFRSSALEMSLISGELLAEADGEDLKVQVPEFSIIKNAIQLINPVRSND